MPQAFSVSDQFRLQTGCDSMQTVDEYAKDGLGTKVYFDSSMIHERNTPLEEEAGYAATCNGMQLPQFLSKEKSTCDESWWMNENNEFDINYDSGKEEVSLGSCKSITRDDHEATYANTTRKNIFSKKDMAQNKEGPSISQVSMDAAMIIAKNDAGALKGDIGTDQVQEDLNEKRNQPPKLRSAS